RTPAASTRKGGAPRPCRGPPPQQPGFALRSRSRAAWWPLRDGAVAIDDPDEVCVRRQGAEGLAPLAGEPRGAERLGHGLIAEANEQRSLQGERHPLDQRARPGLEGARAGAEGVADLGREA